MKERKQKVNITLDPQLYAKAKQYEINVSQVTEVAIIKGLEQTHPIAKELRKKEIYTKCCVCDGVKEPEQMIAILKNRWEVDPDYAICRDCYKNKKYEDGTSVEDKALDYDNYIIPMERLIHQQLKERLKKIIEGV